MTSSYSALSFFYFILHGFAMAGVLVIVWFGWLRTRQIGYLVLASWALATMGGTAFSYLPAGFGLLVFGPRQIPPQSED